MTLGFKKKPPLANAPPRASRRGGGKWGRSPGVGDGRGGLGKRPPPTPDPPGPAPPREDGAKPSRPGPGDREGPGPPPFQSAKNKIILFRKKIDIFKIIKKNEYLDSIIKKARNSKKPKIFWRGNLRPVPTSSFFGAKRGRPAPRPRPPPAFAPAPPLPSAPPLRPGDPGGKEGGDLGEEGGGRGGGARAGAGEKGARETDPERKSGKKGGWGG